MTITGIHHVQITVPVGAEDQARRFYCEVLGCPEVEKPDALRERGGIWVQVGDQQLHIGVESGVDRRTTKAHLAYEVSDIDHWRRNLKGDGVAILESVPIPGFDRFEFRDPFGNRVEMIEPDERQGQSP
jgi:catechol 2,3-dioxygenase-like lactoylglutathione lyase family enzyme